jgi:drug/metabolite transporter (DMT)-like permease
MWIALSLAAMVLMAVMTLLFKQLCRVGVDPSMTLLWLFVVMIPLNLMYIKFARIPFYVPRTALPWVLIVCAAAASFLGNLCGLRALHVAPNPGYPTAITGAQMVLVTLASVWLFAAELSLMKGLGVACCAIGVALICL